MSPFTADGEPAARPSCAPCDHSGCQDRGGNLFFALADERPQSLCKRHFDEVMAKAREVK